MSLYSLNRASLIGNLTRDPELKYTKNGTAVCSLGIATNESVKDGDGWKDVPTFHNLTIWAKLAEIVAKDYVKGDKAYIEGRIENGSYEKDGVKLYTSKVVVRSMMKMAGRPQQDQAQGAHPPQTARTTEDGQQPPTKSETTETEDVSDEIPF